MRETHTVVYPKSKKAIGLAKMAFTLYGYDVSMEFGGDCDTSAHCLQNNPRTRLVAIVVRIPSPTKIWLSG